MNNVYNDDNVYMRSTHTHTHTHTQRHKRHTERQFEGAILASDTALICPTKLQIALIYLHYRCQYTYVDYSPLPFARSSEDEISIRNSSSERVLNNSGAIPTALHSASASNVSNTPVQNGLDTRPPPPPPPPPPQPHCSSAAVHR